MGIPFKSQPFKNGHDRLPDPSKLGLDQMT